METYGWRKDHSVKEWLLKESYRFDFFQAVRLLELERDEELARRAKHSVGESAEPDKEVVRFSAAVDLEFPASDLAEIRQTDGKPARMTVNFLSLAGVTGLLPLPHTELILERAARGDHVLREFLDIFHHRLISLLYRIRKTHRPGFDHQTPGQDIFSEYLFSLIGLGTEGLREQMELEPRSLLHYAGLLARRPRSMAGLETLLADYFQVPVKGAQFMGRWMNLDDAQLTRIGPSGQNQCLGHDVVVLGKRVWDQQAEFELSIGPLPYSQFLDFLPGGAAFDPLCELTRFYINEEFAFSLRLTLKAGERPAIETPSGDSPYGLGKDEGPRLGWTAWLKQVNQSALESDEQVTIPSPTAWRRDGPRFVRLQLEETMRKIGRKLDPINGNHWLAKVRFAVPTPTDNS